MSSFEEAAAVPTTAAREHELCVLNKQIFSSAAIIFALLIIVFTLNGYKRILCIDDLDEINRINRCNDNLERFTILIILIVTFYYLYQTIENYKSDNSCANKNYVVANILSVLATTIRFWTINCSSNNTLNEDNSITDLI